VGTVKKILFHHPAALQTSSLCLDSLGPEGLTIFRNRDATIFATDQGYAPLYGKNRDEKDAQEMINSLEIGTWRAARLTDPGGGIKVLRFEEFPQNFQDNSIAKGRVS
jgi:hypothetical protein